jgi:circadian clock protein KaiC
MDIDRHIDDGLIFVRQIDPSEVSPGEFAHQVVRLVEEKKVSVVVIDSLSGYINAMPGERLLTIHLHELFSYLAQRGASVLVTLALEGPFGYASREGTEISYLADAIIMLRYFEAGGQVRNAISMLKKRGGSHEKSIREYRIAPGGLVVGEPLADFRGVLTGVPMYDGNAGPLLGGQYESRTP